jgi:hypothetical protein
MKRKLRVLSLLTGLSTTVLAAGMFAATSASAATTSPSVATTSASSATLTAANSRGTATLSASRSADTVTLIVKSAPAAPLITRGPAGPGIPDGFNCYWPTCGWQFSHAQTVALFAGSTAAVLAACHRFLGHLGLTYVCDAIAAWISVHVAPKAHQCLYVSTLPVGVIKYVHC